MKLFSLVLFLLAIPAQAEVRLTPQIVVDKILGEGRDAKTIELEAQSAYTAYYNNFGIYDLGFVSSYTFEDSRKDYLSGSGNYRDRTGYWSLGLTQRIATGTTFELDYNRTQQNSLFRSSSSRSPFIVYDVGTLTVTQDLLGNFFGIAERQRNRAARQALESASWQKKESQEQLVLDSLKLFWDTYVARESLREAVSQRDKYEALVKEVENKSRLGFSSPGDLPKARAEFGAQVRNVKAASYTFLSTLDTLLTAMRMEDADREVRFEMKEELPPLPVMVMPQIDSLRSVKVQETLFNSADLTRRSAKLSTNWPELKLIGVGEYTGLDSDRGRAFSMMTSGDKPRYAVTLEMSYKFFSDTNSGTLNSAEVGAERAFNDFLKAKEDLRRQVSSAMENVRFTYAAAVSAVEETKQWESAIRAQESSYRQGRLDFSQLIQDYNSYFKSRATKIRALGDYHIALHTYAATVDELVK